jgi:hypothetical protein
MYSKSYLSNVTAFETTPQASEKVKISWQFLQRQMTTFFGLEQLIDVVGEHLMPTMPYVEFPQGAFVSCRQITSGLRVHSIKKCCKYIFRMGIEY